MASLKYEILLLDRNTRFALWQIKMQAVLAQMDLEDALLGIDKMSSTLTDEEKKRKDRKALTQLHRHLSNKILQDVMKEKTATALCKRLEQICMSKTLTSKLHMKQHFYAHRLEKGASVHEHLTVFKEILSNLEAMERHDLYSRESLTVDEVYDSLTSYDKMKHHVVKLDSQGDGYRYTAESGVLKISKGSLVVMKGQRKFAKLYVLQGSTVTGDATVASSSLSNDDITKLWHMRLGHMSENGMAELSKRGLLDGQGICKLNFCEHCVFGKQKRTGKQIKYLCTDNGLEFYSDEFNRLCKSEGIMRHLTVRHTPQQNGIAKWKNRMIMEKVRCMLSNANLPKSFWVEAASTTCFLINQSPSVAIEKKTPQEVWPGNPTNYSDLKIFRCPAYAHVDNEKLEPRSIKYIFLGYKAGVKGYKLWCPENRKVVEHQINTESTPQAITKIHNRVASSPQYSISKNRTRREIKLSKKYAEADLVAYALNVAEDIDANQEPFNYSEAKEGTPGIEESRYKARLVAKGYSQISGVDFTNVFSPIVKHSSIRALLGIVAMHDLELEQLDVKTAFLHGELEEDCNTPNLA
ncbi:hypothetical protein CXB51_031687 [Gossypium anomalum]|uniref:Integrase catalytic domain-containing protein n=1 Tax=Gossypium anomalum TaxID=47600 RepID=A0A8J5YQV5_9ROSI|nr:hypothetical protein CXB51_031687 [Gossypium anomalum]